MIDIFYNQIINEAKNGKIYTYNSNEDSIFYNIIFNTYIMEDNNLIKSDTNKLVPTLNIKNKNKFNELLTDYVTKSLNFYSENSFYKEENKIKKILALLWSNATIEDFNDPITFLQNRINFLDNKLNIDNELFKHDDLLDSDIYINNKKSKLINETPYEFEIILKKDKDIHILPKIYYGISNNKVYIYAIQNKNISNNTKYDKFIKRKLYSINEGLDVNNDTYDNYMEGNLKDVTPSFLYTISIFVKIINDLGYKDIIIPSILITRWNGKELSNDIKKDYYNINIDELEQKSIDIQKNLTEKLIRTFLRLSHHINGIDIMNYPSELNSSLILKIDEIKDINNELINNIFKDKNKKAIK